MREEEKKKDRQTSPITTCLVVYFYSKMIEKGGDGKTQGWEGAQGCVKPRSKRSLAGIPATNPRV
jgi:hypothetical protein